MLKKVEATQKEEVSCCKGALKKEKLHKKQHHSDIAETFNYLKGKVKHPSTLVQMRVPGFAPLFSGKACVVSTCNLQRQLFIEELFLCVIIVPNDDGLLF